MTFLLGTLMFVTAMVRRGEIPRIPLVMYVVGAVPVAFRAFVPEEALDLGLLTVALGIGWLAIWLFNSSSRIETWSMPTSAALHHLDA